MEDDVNGKLIQREEVMNLEVENPPDRVSVDICPRLKLARKSLTRCRSVEETFGEECNPCLKEEDEEEEEEEVTKVIYEDERHDDGNVSNTRPKSLLDGAAKFPEVQVVSPQGVDLKASCTSPAGASSRRTSDRSTGVGGTNLQSPTTPKTEDRGSSCRSSGSECFEGEPAAAAAKGYDDISASMSVIRMEKFALEKRRVSRILPKSLHRTFVDPDVEQLFQAYHERQRRSDLNILLAAGATFAVFSVTLCLVDLPNQSLAAPLALGSIGGLHILLLLLCRLHVFPERTWMFLPYIVWALFLTGVGVYVSLGPPTPVPRQALLWVILLHFLVFVGLPLRLPSCILLTGITAVAHLLISALLTPSAQRRPTQLAANFLLVSGATLLGLMSYFFADKKHRRAFLETRQSLEVKMVIEEQSREQERLLLSVLPKHVAETMRQDLGRGGDGQFKKIYMSRHENVSVLFADIVGFTAISSTYTASELVKMLNELFARFDGLAEKYHQLRIKILGDCYYCVSGAPRERSDHAVNCVHMGLSMIDAIKYVRETTGCTVDMRVGIHTGAVLAGVLGQRQWQFDVYSKDVVLANKMESSGKPGRVHISNKTLQYIGDEFEVEPAYGEKREDALRAAGLKTYFISKVLMPYKPRPSLQSMKNGTRSSSSQPSRDVPSENTMASRDSTTLSTVEDAKVLKTLQEGNPDNSFKSKLQKELVNRDGRKDLLSQTNLLSLSFREGKTEHAYRHHRETFSGAATTAVPLVLLLITLARFLLLPRAGGGVVILLVGVAILTSMASVSAARSFPVRVCNALLIASDRVHTTVGLRVAWFTTLVILAAAANTLDMYLCDKPMESLHLENTSTLSLDTITAHNHSLNIDNDSVYQLLQALSQEEEIIHTVQDQKLCPHPAYYSYFTLLILLAASLLAQVSYMIKSVVMVGVVSVQCTMNLLIMSHTLETAEDWTDFDDHRIIQDHISLSVELCLITLLLIVLNRQTEKTSRVLYLWRREVEEQRERAADIRQRNEALVYNILPQHVATHFMGIRRKKHEELYSQSYDEIGVLFASMPNFGDFYSEESVNNQGLECLRFLNEVISDFDGLLELSQFHDIIKIKTIGSTYMAASGLNPSRQVKEDDPVKVRWAHLALLVDFAFELVRALQSINEQSFNHFVLRMGINHGPITAGVIGARKPHYDIWGNTVNVASRMESTGKAGCIQVTEETTKILQHFGYVFEQRGLIAVKGKGELMTYYLVGKTASPQQVNGESLDYSKTEDQSLT